MKAPTLVAPASNVPVFDHVFFAFVGDQNAQSTEAPEGAGRYITKNAAAPYLNQTLAAMGSQLGEMYAMTQPSDRARGSETSLLIGPTGTGTGQLRYRLGRHAASRHGQHRKV